MGRLELVGLGMASLDILARSPGNSLFTRGVSLQELIIDGGGMACNAMVAAQRLGAAAGFVGTFGSDRSGRLKLQALRESGVDTGRIVERPDPDDQVVLVHIQAETGERSFHPLAAPWRRPLDPAELDREYLTQADFLLVDGIHPQAALAAADWMHAAGRRVMLDANVSHGPPSAEIRELVKKSDFLICSAGFCQTLVNEPDLSEAARRTLAMGPRVVVQTDGERGSRTFTDGQSFHLPAFPVHVEDTTSAGDVFHGAYLVGLLKGWDLRRTGAFASAAAALKCTKIGRVGFPTFDQTLKVMESQAPFLV